MIPQRTDERGRPPRIAVVGGGPGGLLTAYFLQNDAARPLQTTIYEASDRLGGKILTPSFRVAPVAYEAGAAELYDYTPAGHDPLRELVDDLALPTVPLAGSSVLHDGRCISNLDDVADCLGPAARRELEAFDLDARSRMTPREFYASDEWQPVPPEPFTAVLDAIGSPAVRRHVETLIHSDLATEPRLTSGCYGLQNYLMNDPAYMRLYCIAGGNERLVEAIVARLDAMILRSEPVTHVAATDDGRLRISSLREGLRHDAEFDAVVLALPLQHLGGIAFEGPGLADAVRDHCRRHDHPAHYLRVTAVFDEPFWRERIDGGYVMLDAFGGCCLYDESSRDPGGRHGVLGWLLGGDAAEEMADLDDHELVARVLASLPATLGGAGVKPLETRVHRWIGAVSALPGGWRPRDIDSRHRPDPVGHPDVFVVGDYLFDSTLNGVLDSASHVAGWLASAIADRGLA